MMGLSPTMLLTLFSHSLLSTITCSIIAFLVMTMKISLVYKLNYDIRTPNKNTLQWSIYTCDFTKINTVGDLFLKTHARTLYLNRTVPFCLILAPQK